MYKCTVTKKIHFIFISLLFFIFFQNFFTHNTTLNLFKGILLLNIKMELDEHAELSEFEPQTQRLVIQMQEAMRKIWAKTRGAVRQKNIKEFNKRIANLIEWKANKVKEELDEAYDQIEKLNFCLDRQFQKKWELRDKLLARIKELEDLYGSKLEICPPGSEFVLQNTTQTV